MVVDASFLVAAFLEEAHTDFARGVLEAHADADLAAPALVKWEIANVAWKKLRRGQIQDSHLAAMAEFVDALRLDHPPAPNGAELALLAGLAGRTGLSAYDAAYLMLASERSASLATTDEQLAQAARDAGVNVHSPFA